MSDEERESPENFLNHLLASVTGILAAMIVSVEGVPIASKPSTNLDEGHVAAMIAVMLSLGKKATRAWQKGEFQQVFVRGVNGYFLIRRWGPDKILAISTTADVKLGYILDDFLA